MIKKGFIVLAIVLSVGIAIAGITPLVFGIKAENAYRDWVEHLVEFGDFRVVSTKYNRGWFNSRAETVLEFSRRNKPILTFIEHDHLVHGPLALNDIFRGGASFEPFLARVKTQVWGEAKNEPELESMLQLLPPLEIETVFQLQGNCTSSISMQSFSYRHENLKESLTWKGLTGHSSFTREGSKTEVDLNLPGAELVDEDFSSSFADAGISLDSEDMENSKGRLYSISFKAKNAEIHNFSVDSGGIESVFLGGLETSWSSSTRNGLITGSQEIGFDKLILNDSNQIGPGEFKFTALNIDLKAFNGIRSSIYGSGAELLRDSEGGFAILGSVMKYLPQLAHDGPEFEIKKLSLVTPDGNLSGRAKIYLDSESSQLEHNPFYLIYAINAEAMLSIPKPMFESIIKEITRAELREASIEERKQPPAGDRLNRLVRSASDKRIKTLLRLNIFTFKDDKYELNLAYSKGLLELNGKSITTPLISP